MRITLDERIRSLKIGGISAVAFTLPSLVFLAVHAAFLGEAFTVFTSIARLAGGLLAGFLFGVTYRYIVRDDTNPHLKDGAVAAFSLVRGLAPLELSGDIATDALGASLFLGESFVGFLASRTAIDSIFVSKIIKL